jgi:hypothetical protein
MMVLRRSRRALVAAAWLTLFVAAPASAAGLENGGFEAGLQHWSEYKVVAGPGGYYDDGQGTPEAVDCRTPDGVCVIAGSDTFTAQGGGYDGDPITHTVIPPEGTHMLRLGGPFTSAGELQPIERYRVEQAFVVQPGQTRIDLSYNVFTWDYTGFDRLRFRVTLVGDDDHVLAQREVSSFGQGVALKSTGWRPANLDLTGYEGREVLLRIEAGGTGDPLYGFWAYVDGGAALPPSPVSAPSHGSPPNTPGGQPVIVNEQTDPETGQAWFSIPASQAAQFPGGCVPLPLSVPIDAGGGVVSAVQLVLNQVNGTRVTKTMTDPPPADGVWNATIDCVKTGELFVEYTLTEGSDAQRFLIPIGGLVLIDPQGVVYDKAVYDAAVAGGASAAAARAQAAIPGATVRLQRKAGDAFTNVLSGDPGILPKVNPQITQADGLYQWDVSAGDYRVVVSKAGYDTVTSPVVSIPPPVLDLHIAMNRTGTQPPGNGGGGGGGGGSGGGGPPAPGSGPGAPPLVTPFAVPKRPAAAVAVPCARLKALALRRCKADRKLAAALLKCGRLRGRKRTTCRTKARAVAKCERLATNRRTTSCLRKLARKPKRRS